ncbi:MAG: tryptophan-rich sensory protein [candidate division WOR-3 bacterium]
MCTGMVFALMAAALPLVESIVDSVFARRAGMATRYQSASYLADYHYWERDSRGRLLREETCRRRVYAGTGQTQVEFLEVTLNGRRVDGRNRERLIAALRRKGLVQDEAMMPFFRDTKHVYRYELLGEDTCLERSAWVLGFMPVRKSQQTVEGRAFIDKENYDVLAMEFRPAKLPWVCAGTKMKLWCAILVTVILFFRVSRAAGILMLPYIGWVSFASALNAGIWVLNR